MKTNTQSTATSAVQPELAAYIGLDWADEKHDLALWVPGTDRVERSILPHSPEALAEWIAGLHTRFGGRPVGVLLEQTRGALCHALWHHEHLVLYPVNPKTVPYFRQALRPSGKKDDPLDAELALEILRNFRSRLRPWLPQDPDTRQLALLCEDRRSLVDRQTGLSNALRATLKGYFPQGLELAGQPLASPMATAFLQKWPTLQAAQQAKPSQLRGFYYRHNSRSEELIQQRLALLQKALPLTQDTAVIAASVRRVSALAAELAVVHQQIALYDKAIAEVFARHPEHALCESFDGAGAALAPRLAAVLGTDRSRWNSAQSLQQYSGIAPVTEKSGKSAWTHLRWACPKFVRQTFHEWADASRQGSAWARRFYQDKIDHGLGHHAALRALAFKWQRILWRCWHNGQAYDEATYLRSLQTKGVRLYADLYTDRVKQQNPAAP